MNLIDIQLERDEALNKTVNEKYNEICDYFKQGNSIYEVRLNYHTNKALFYNKLIQKLDNEGFYASCALDENSTCPKIDFRVSMDSQAPQLYTRISYGRENAITLIVALVVSSFLLLFPAMIMGDKFGSLLGLVFWAVGVLLGIAGVSGRIYFEAKHVKLLDYKLISSEDQKYSNIQKGFFDNLNNIEEIKKLDRGN